MGECLIEWGMGRDLADSMNRKIEIKRKSAKAIETTTIGE